jgi:hypothetical protein
MSWQRAYTVHSRWRGMAFQIHDLCKRRRLRKLDFHGEEASELMNAQWRRRRTVPLRVALLPRRHRIAHS